MCPDYITMMVLLLSSLQGWCSEKQSLLGNAKEEEEHQGGQCATFLGV